MGIPAADRLVADRYALKTPLGRGGMGVVWRARDAVLGREVAVKEVVFPATLPDEERRSAQARVMREARAAARLNHPAAVTLYDVVQDHGGTFIVMELVNAPTLADLIRTGGPLPPERVAEIGAQLASALEAAHRAGIVHRDVKPGNVMVPADGMAKLADFGIASLQGDPQLTSTGLVIGSPAYMAPEQAKGEASGPPTDFWALGATMFYAVEGEPPFDRPTSIATLAAVVNEEPRAPRRAGPLTPLVTALLAKDPEARPSGPELRAQLGRLVDAARMAPATEVLPTQGPGRTVPLPGPAAASAPEPASPAAIPAGAPPPSADGRAQGRPEDAPAFEPAQASGHDPDQGLDWPSAQRPARPVLPPAPPVERSRAGRRVGVLGLLLVGGLLAAWLVNTLGTDGGNKAAPATSTSSGAVGGATSRPPDTTGPAATTGPPTTKKAPATTDPPARGEIPAGWRSHTRESGSYAVAVPPGWSVNEKGGSNETDILEPGTRRFFWVLSKNPADEIPQASESYRNYIRGRYGNDGYREVAFVPKATYAGRPATLYEFEARMSGRLMHVRHINVLGKTWGYNVYFRTPAELWSGSQKFASGFEQGFRPLG